MKVLVGLLFVTLLHTSFGVEDRKIRRKRNVLVDLDPLSSEEIDNEFKLSSEETSKLDRFLQKTFMSMSMSMSFSLPATEAPSSSPVATPSIAPSSKPTIPYICPIDIVEGRTFKFVAANMCFRLQLFAGGKLEADPTDRTCSSPVFTDAPVEFSLYGGIDSTTNTVILNEGQGGYSGNIEIKETPSVVGDEFQLIRLQNKVITGRVIISSCASEPTLIPSSIPSAVPSAAPLPSVPCSISDFTGDTFFFSGTSAGVNMCIKARIGPGGDLYGNPNDPFCSNTPGYVEQVQFSVFDSFSDNEAVYTTGAAGWSGTIVLKENPGVATTQLVMLAPPRNQIFTAALIIPSCGN